MLFIQRIQNNEALIQKTRLRLPADSSFGLILENMLLIFGTVVVRCSSFKRLLSLSDLTNHVALIPPVINLKLTSTRVVSVDSETLQLYLLRFVFLY